ncbi:hypothetical protein F53441_1081 [Fusarium austroafricanum]|uniref:Uncharacterized protein n=1 Tax=Fusarium austroafricanum TaxID=2364996 RepID=A0A8H4P2N0_9HYPO|nr:hypothetical protein F53441_1081 [Fusarium austroafricanum]
MPSARGRLEIEPGNKFTAAFKVKGFVLGRKVFFEGIISPDDIKLQLSSGNLIHGPVDNPEDIYTSTSGRGVWQVYQVGNAPDVDDRLLL